ncbi:hypothetical protein AMTR_s00009p00072720 [Amborella trichopoda]|uniref:RNA polymerase sigma factor n=1 Tax=Amborella trichopoda TaxID=13333 RepID=W1NI04_AMBTC|nr:hypothetical protein AMTR_s00009p00072720 [Amborella trichopoda]
MKCKFRRPSRALSSTASPNSPGILTSPDQAPLTATMLSTTSAVRHFPASVVLHEQRDDLRSPTSSPKEDKAYQEVMDRARTEVYASIGAETKNFEIDQYLKDFERQLLYWPALWYLSPSRILPKSLLSLPFQCKPLETDIESEIKESRKKQTNCSSLNPMDVLVLAKRAVMASKAAAALVEHSDLTVGNPDGDISPCSGLKEICIQVPDEDMRTTIRSKRHLERQIKRRRVPKKLKDFSANFEIGKKPEKVKNKSFDPNDPLRFFLWGPITKQLLTEKEESELFVKIQDLMRVEEVKKELEMQFGCEPTVVEWARAAGMSYGSLQSCIHFGRKSREKMIYANFRLVVHVAKNYQGRGLSIQDLLQEGSVGLMKSLEKFKPKTGCRFSTYAYWWIRQAIRKSLFQNSRTIRLPENVYGLLTKIKNARRLYFQEGHRPTNEELAQRVGITVDKLETVRVFSKLPVSIQQPVWSDQDVTIQEITADPKVETPEKNVAKQLMRRHVRNLLSLLNPRERQVINLRFGIQGRERKSLSEIGGMFNVSKERIRQVESKALEKLKNCTQTQGLEVYAELLN